MSTLTALAKAQAVVTGRAQPIATVRHLHLVDHPLVLIPLTLAGETNAPLAALVGDAPEAARLLVVPQPRNRDQRYAFAAELGRILLPYLAARREASEEVPVDRGRQIRLRHLDAPQLLVPNPGGITFLRLLGRDTRFRRTDGDWPVDPVVPLLGRWLTFLADQAEIAGSSLTVAMTEALTTHWATGQSAMEDQHLGALLGWLDPPPGLTGAQAAALAEEPSRCPPAGPVTDPGFDNEHLAPAMDAYAAAVGDPVAERAAYARLAELLRGQLEPTWELMWRGVELLRGLPPGQRVADRWASDRDAFTGFAEQVDAGAPPQRKRDTAVAAATRLERLERAAETYARQRAYDDPLVMAGYRLTGEAFLGEVTMADPTRIDDTGRVRKLRPRIMLVTADPVRQPEGTQLCSPIRPAQIATLIRTEPARDGRTSVVLELSGGMGRSLTAPPGSVPEVGERLCYTTLTEKFSRTVPLPEPERTPWTHGGPPPEYEPELTDAPPGPR